MFGRFTTSDKRQKLFAQLEEYVSELSKIGKVDHVIADGSFITEKDTPSDIDIIVALKPDQVPGNDWNPWHLCLVSKRFVRRKYGFDILVDRNGAVEYREHVDYFHQVKEVPGMTKGLVRLTV